MIKLRKNKQPCLFTLEQANNLFPIVQRITEKYMQKMQFVLQKLNTLSRSDTLDLIDIELQKKALIQSWHSKMKKLGVKPCCRLFVEKGLLCCCWVVEFDAGDGYFCWKYPEPKISFWHRYSDGNSGRIPLETYLASVNSQSKKPANQNRNQNHNENSLQS